MAQGMGDVTGDFANNGILDGDAQPVSPTDKLEQGADQDDEQGRGELLDLAKSDPEEAAKKVKKLWEIGDPAAERLKVFWDQYKLWLMGIRGVRARPASTEVNRWELYVPPGALDMPPVLDQTESLLDKVVSHVLSDKAKPKCVPADDSPQERDAAQFAERLLSISGSEAEQNDAALFRRACKKSGIYGSSFIYHYVDADGWEADKQSPDGRRVRKKICKRILPSYYVRPIPETAQSIADADGILVMDTTTVGDLKRRFPQIVDGDEEQEPWSVEDWTDVVEWKPKASRWARPWFASKKMSGAPEFKENGMPTDTSPVVTLALYMNVGGEYKDGAYLLTAGGTKTLYAEDWLDHSQEDAPRSLSLPVVQWKQLTDDVSDNFFGRCLIQMLGPIGEIRASIVLSWINYLDRFGFPHTFLPLGSVVQPDQLAARDGRAIYFNPQGQPVVEQIPPFPADAKEFLDRAGAVEQDIVGLYGALGDSRQSNESGDHLALNQSAAAMNVTQISDNAADAIMASWRVTLEQSRAFITEPQLLRYEDEDGGYREKAWQGLDIGNTRQVDIEPGTFTGLNQEAREAKIIQWQQLQWITPDQAKELVGSGMRAQTGLEDNPFLRKVRRELSAWRKGPPPEWMQAVQQQQQQEQRSSAIAALTGSQPVPPQPPPPPNIFLRVASDLEQDVARIRHAEIRHELSSSGFTQQPPQWQGVLTQEYTAMKASAGVLTVQEQGQAAQAQQAAATAAIVQEKVAPIEAQGQIDTHVETGKALAELHAEQRKLAQEITLLREQAALKAGVPPAQQIMQDTLLRDSALFSATGPTMPFAPGIVPGGLDGVGAPMADEQPPSGQGGMVGAPTGPNPGPAIPGGAGNV